MELRDIFGNLRVLDSSQGISGAIRKSLENFECIRRIRGVSGGLKWFQRLQVVSGRLQVVSGEFQRAFMGVPVGFTGLSRGLSDV